MPRVIYLVHELPGRIRLRLPWIRAEPAIAGALADRIAASQGMARVEVRPLTGSLVCHYDTAALDGPGVIERVRELTGVDLVVRPGELVGPLEQAELLRAAQRRGPDVARAAARVFHDLNIDVLRSSAGRFDLASLVALGFAMLGATNVLFTRKLPAPPWFNLAWWAFRTFATMESAAIKSCEDGEGTGPAVP